MNKEDEGNEDLKESFIINKKMKFELFIFKSF